jgi:predicted nucleic acid-binding protein
MPVLVDTNVLLDIDSDDPEWADWAAASLTAAVRGHGAFINPVIYAEFSIRFDRVEDVDAALRNMSVTVAEIPRGALFLAGRAYLNYRRRGGSKTGVLSDFFIGAHAAVTASPLLTRDMARYRAYFPSVELIGPE